MKRFLFMFLMIYGYSLLAQVEYSDNGPDNSAFNSFFYIDAANYASNDSGKTRVDFFIQVPNSSIQFVKRNNRFFANYNITLTFMDKDKENILSDRTWKEQVSADVFTQTTSKNNYNLSYRTYNLKPGDYNFRCRVEDLDSKRYAVKEFPFVVKSISDTFGISDVVLIAHIMKDSTGETVMPNVSKLMTNRIDSLAFYYEVYSNKNRHVNIEYALQNIKADSTLKVSDSRDIVSGKSTIYYTIRNINFKLGDYVLKVDMTDPAVKGEQTVQKKFYSKIFGMPNSITDLDMAVRELLYIAAPSERAYIEEAKDYNEKLDRFLEFWDKKKPNPRTDDNPILYEYYRRIDYANNHFKGLSGGWRSDMGMVYVTFGPPSNVERHPFDSNSRPYEIWDYYDMNRSFVFVDQTGFGDYRLYNPDYSRWPGYRQ